MNFSHNDLLSINNILADVLRDVDDERTRLRTKGYYKRQIKHAIEELAFDTYFDERFKDIPLPSNLRLAIPSGAFNIRNIFIFNGEDCKVEDSKIVWDKKDFLSSGKGMGYTARNKSGQTDPFILSYTSDYDIYYCNIQNGIIVFSDACAGYKSVRIQYNGIASDIDQYKIVPRMFREAVTLFVEEKVFASLKAKDIRKYRPLWLDIYNQLYSGSPFRGKWAEAKDRAKRLDTKKLRDLSVYINRLNYK